MSVKPPICPECFGNTWGTQFFDRLEKRVHLARVECTCCKKHGTLFSIGDRHHPRAIFIAHRESRARIRSQAEEDSLQLLLQPTPDLRQYANQHAELIAYELIASASAHRWQEIVSEHLTETTMNSVREGFLVKETAC